MISKEVIDKMNTEELKELLEHYIENDNRAAIKMVAQNDLIESLDRVNDARRYLEDKDASYKRQAQYTYNYEADMIAKYKIVKNKEEA